MPATSSLQPGDPAPDFTLPSVDSEGTVSLDAFRGKSPVLLAFERGFWCAFCRRHVARLSAIRTQLQVLGVETLAIMATEPERARLYLQYHPVRLSMAADPSLESHRAYGLHSVPMTPLNVLKMFTTRVNPTGELPKPVPLMKIAGTLDRLDHFEQTEVDRGDAQRQRTQLVGQFLVDRQGIVRWSNIEGAREGMAGMGKLPSEEEFLAAARVLPG